MYTCDGALWRAPFRKIWIQFLSCLTDTLSDVRCRCIWLFLTGCYCLGVMIWTSGYMISVLQRQAAGPTHSQQQNFPRPSHDARATHAILILVSFLDCFYSLFHFDFLLLILNPCQWLMDTVLLASFMFPSFQLLCAYQQWYLFL